MMKSSLLVLLALFCIPAYAEDQRPFNDPARVAERSAAVPAAERSIAEERKREQAARREMLRQCEVFEDIAWVEARVRHPGLTDAQVRVWVAKYDIWVKSCVDLYGFKP